MKEKDELVSDLQDTIHSLQRGEAFLDVSLPINDPIPLLNASFTDRVGFYFTPVVIVNLLLLVAC